MNDLEYRFSEIVTAVSLIEDSNWDDLEQDVFILPNFTAGLEDMRLINALTAQTARESDDWRLRFYTFLLNSAMSHIMESDGGVNDGDLNAIALAMNVAWVSREASAIFKAASILSHITDNSNAEYPEFAFTVLQSPSGAVEIGKANDPYALLRGERPIFSTDEDEM